MTLTKSDCIHLLNLVKQKVNRCQWVLENGESELAKVKANQSKRIFQPIMRKLEEGALES